MRQLNAWVKRSDQMHFWSRSECIRSGDLKHTDPPNSLSTERSLHHLVLSDEKAMSTSFIPSPAYWSILSKVKLFICLKRHKGFNFDWTERKQNQELRWIVIRKCIMMSNLHEKPVEEIYEIHTAAPNKKPLVYGSQVHFCKFLTFVQLHLTMVRFSLINHCADSYAGMLITPSGRK